MLSGGIVPLVTTDHDPPDLPLTDDEKRWADSVLAGEDATWPGTTPTFGYGDQVRVLAAELGYIAAERLPGFPWVIRAVVDSHKARWRESGEQWVLYVDGRIVERGIYDAPSSEEPAATLRDILNRVRTHLLRERCNHSRAFVEGDPWCGECGLQIRPLGPVRGAE